MRGTYITGGPKVRELMREMVSGQVESYATGSTRDDYAGRYRIAIYERNATGSSRGDSRSWLVPFQPLRVSGNKREPPRVKPVASEKLR